jgi:hypothetical protein
MATSSIFDVRSLGGLYSTCAFTATGAGAIAAGSETTAFQDDLNTATASNYTQVNATQNQGGGQIANGTHIVAFGLEVRVRGENSSGLPIVLTKEECDQAISFTSIHLNLAGNTILAGPPQLFPAAWGANAVASAGGSTQVSDYVNGGPGTMPYRLPRRGPIQLKSQDQFTATVKADKAFAGVTASAQIVYVFYLPASRALTFRSLAGA